MGRSMGRLLFPLKILMISMGMVGLPIRQWQRLILRGVSRVQTTEMPTRKCPQGGASCVGVRVWASTPFQRRGLRYYASSHAMLARDLIKTKHARAEVIANGFGLEVRDTSTPGGELRRLNTRLTAMCAADKVIPSVSAISGGFNPTGGRHRHSTNFSTRNFVGIFAGIGRL
jgi:hypothetical protein